MSFVEYDPHLANPTQPFSKVLNFSGSFQVPENLQQSPFKISTGLLECEYIANLDNRFINSGYCWAIMGPVKAPDILTIMLFGSRNGLQHFGCKYLGQERILKIIVCLP
ncbi:hypothetical protein PHYBLDRAFT_73669 [Phycomyces blakesleeanus NRRL 1555(-)]|uniref:Uncharacterized protein n=1 Tax=Phycomyces blakesleeanus (strain ATCC 8743b / DSM 1359 / FGSC 10004 / NBRC 33097 / NRRL 1555) TaxID=763407 RepID=A0A162T3K5_PHYB8|nr:hypothetical protein PHYBLDRAFT_73669 [Phycomyces blakesleeanus NRRL 1555(-)]OAD66002.1 hypothetical protein PHYBLDRAFT_73669 [Phycomyces blakesleeanus NRRL 1555(-)]|eukprot:XP_018284042.1 hypothetical protein PHYBLDRAFT_73669 [Phycomyces blakesleeanus NRRL 1555(-)]